MSSSELVDITGLDKVKLMLALYEKACRSMYDVGHLSAEEARCMFDKQKGNFDYVNGRCFKCNLSGDFVSPWGYDRDAGKGRFEEVVTELRKNGDS
ncbi:hypothetical protein MGYG_00326 [Nannizzia gypsea CBS 118893]|uniref:Uncharacterized protein n=1 Tax=Arthroderma gypseum (strain ATCC MYA-4604 / CBS 118893) TaxID=535722 RepID=E5QYU7_ARTGP|nr:hypothetical protein MGYG_00326 [Nannizzia gypsea CBS 118893]EFQ97285.1 hypothetical protein MGYG_00326 [Nannizzia gypsea CBS 118893]